MEIRNNTPMYYNRVQNRNQTSFGMAMLKPDDMEAFVKATGLNDAGVIGKVKKRGLLRLKKQLDKLVHIDVKYVKQDRENACQIIDRTQNGEVVATIKKDSEDRVISPLRKAVDKMNALDAQEKAKENVSTKTKLRAYFQVAYRTLKAMVISPEEFMPSSLLTATKKAKELDKVRIKEIKAAKAEELAKQVSEAKAKARLEKAVKDMEEVFGK